MRAPADLCMRNTEVEGIGPWMWREADHWGWAHPASEFPALRNLLLANTKERGVIVQAGGCMGMYPRLWSEHFATVYTFEPEPTNFYCLVANCPSDRIIKVQAALSDQPCMCRLSAGLSYNAGAYALESEPGGTLTMRLDSLAFDRIDAIQLDCEGHETKVIAGAINTLIKHRPVIAIERPDDKLKGMLEELGYREVGHCGTMPDVVFAIAG